MSSLKNYYISDITLFSQMWITAISEIAVVQNILILFALICLIEANNYWWINYNKNSIIIYQILTKNMILQ